MRIVDVQIVSRIMRSRATLTIELKMRGSTAVKRLARIEQVDRVRLDLFNAGCLNGCSMDISYPANLEANMLKRHRQILRLWQTRDIVFVFDVNGLKPHLSGVDRSRVSVQSTLQSTLL